MWGFFFKRMAFRDKHKIQDHWEKTTYHVEREPYVGLLVFRITHFRGRKDENYAPNLLLPFGGNIEDSENEGSWQGVNRPPDCILAVSDGVISETEVVLTDHKPMCKGDAIHVHVYRLYFSQIIGLKP